MCADKKSLVWVVCGDTCSQCPQIVWYLSYTVLMWEQWYGNVSPGISLTNNCRGVGVCLLFRALKPFFSERIANAVSLYQIIHIVTWVKSVRNSSFYLVFQYIVMHFPHKFMWVVEEIYEGWSWSNCWTFWGKSNLLIFYIQTHFSISRRPAWYTYISHAVKWHTCGDSEWQSWGSFCPCSLSGVHFLRSAVEGWHTWCVHFEQQSEVEIPKGGRNPLWDQSALQRYCRIDSFHHGYD